jgi:hypothetical protein
MKRACATCASTKVDRVEALFVASDSAGGIWFDCGNHNPLDNPYQRKRTTITPIRDWFRLMGVDFDALEDLVDDEAPPTER